MVDATRISVGLHNKTSAYALKMLCAKKTLNNSFAELR